MAERRESASMARVDCRRCLPFTQRGARAAAAARSALLQVQREALRSEVGAAARRARPARPARSGLRRSARGCVRRRLARLRRVGVRAAASPPAPPFARGCRPARVGVVTRVNVVPHSCPKRPETGCRSAAARSARNGQEASNHQGLRAFVPNEPEWSACPAEAEVACSNHAGRTSAFIAIRSSASTT
jgi:hypothetical protein